MPDLTITINPPQALRTARAFAFLNEDGSNATVPQVEGWLRLQLRTRVRQHEHQVAGAAADVAADATLTAEGW